MNTDCKDDFRKQVNIHRIARRKALRETAAQDGNAALIAVLILLALAWVL